MKRESREAKRDRLYKRYRARLRRILTEEEYQAWQQFDVDMDEFRLLPVEAQLKLSEARVAADPLMQRVNAKSAADPQLQALARQITKLLSPRKEE